MNQIKSGMTFTRHPAFLQSALASALIFREVS
jgi:hypothetical protein